jgi:transketolase
VPSLKPVDADRLTELLHGHQLVVTTEDHSVIGGLGSLVARTVTDRGLGARIRRIGIQDTWGESAPNQFLLDKYGLSAEKVAEAVREALVGEV